MTFCPNWKSPDTIRIMNKILTSLGSYSLGQDDINLLTTNPQAFEKSHSIAYMEAIYKAYNIWSDTQGDEKLIDKAFNTNNGISQNDKSYYRGIIGTPVIDKNGNLVIKAENADWQKKLKSTSKGVSLSTKLSEAERYALWRFEQEKNNIMDNYLSISDQEFELDKLEENGYSLIQINKSVLDKLESIEGIENEKRVVTETDLIINKGDYNIETYNNEGLINSVITIKNEPITPFVNTAFNNRNLTSEQIANIQELKQLEPAYTVASDEKIQDFLNSIYPESKVKDIVWHGTTKQFDKFKNISRGFGYYFGDKKIAKQYSYQNWVSNLTKEDKQLLETASYLDDEETEQEIINKYPKKREIPSIINITNPKNIETFEEYDNLQKSTNYDSGVLQWDNQYVVFEPEQITILNSSETIQKFQEFLKSDNNYYQLNSFRDKANFGVFIQKGEAKLYQSLYHLEPNITEERIKSIYDNYVALMGKNESRKDKVMSYETFSSLLDNYQVFKYKNTYIFGQYDSKNKVFITRVNSSTNSKELLSEALPIISKEFNVISFVPKDVKDKYVRSGYTSSNQSYLYNFKGEIMDKFAVVSNKNIANTIFGKSIEDITSEDIKAYNNSIPLKSNYSFMKGIKGIELLASISDKLYNIQGVRFRMSYELEDNYYSLKMKELGLTDEEIGYIFNWINKLKITDSNSFNEIFSKIQLAELQGGILKDLSNIGGVADEELTNKLTEWAKQFGIEVRSIEEFKKRTGKDAIAVADTLNKVIYYNSEIADSTTFPEEISHFYVEMLGDKHPLLNDALNKIETWVEYKSIYEEYKSVYLKADGSPDIRKIKKEALGKAIASRIVGKEKAKSSEFWKVIDDIIQKIKSIFKNDINKFNIELIVDEIAEDILTNTNKYLGFGSFKNNQIPSNFELKSYENTIKNNPNLEKIVNSVSELGGVLTGSLAYRKQGTTYRNVNESIHDLDFKIPYTIHSKIGIESFIEQAKNKINLVRSIKISGEFNAFYDENKIYTSIGYVGGIKIKNWKEKGYYNQGDNLWFDKNNKELNEPRLLETGELAFDGVSIDFFFETENKPLLKTKDNFAFWTAAFLEKIKMGRDKDAFDYRTFIPFSEYRNGDIREENIYYQKANNTTSLLGGTPAQLEVYNQVTELLGPDIPVQFIQELIDGVGVIAFDKSLGLILSDSVSPVNGEAYHEAFEIVWNTLLDNETKADLLSTLRTSANYNSNFVNSIKEEYPEFSNTGKDKEVLAELFREYMVTGNVVSISMPTSFFDKIVALIKRVAMAFGYSGSGQKNSEQNPIEKLFQDIKNKKYQYNSLAVANMGSNRVYMKKALQNPMNVDKQGEPLIITTTQVKEYVDLVSATLSDIMVVKGDISITEVMNDVNILDEVYGKATKKIYDLGGKKNNLHTRLIVSGIGADKRIITAEGGINDEGDWTTHPNWQDTDFYKIIKPAFEDYWKQYGINFKTKYVQIEDTVANQSEISEDGLNTQSIDDVDTGNTNNTDYTVSKEVSIYDRTASEFSVMDSVSKDTFALLGLLTHNPEFIVGKSEEELRRLGIFNNFGTASLIPISTSVGYLLNTLKDLSHEDMLYKLVNKAQLITGVISEDLATAEDLATLEYDKLYNTWIYSLVSRILPIELSEPITKEELSVQLSNSNGWTQSKVTSMNGLMMAFNRVYLDHFIAVAGLDGSYRVFSSNQDTKEDRLKEKLEGYQLTNNTLTITKKFKIGNVEKEISILDYNLIDKLAGGINRTDKEEKVKEFLNLLGIEENSAIKISKNDIDRALVMDILTKLSNSTPDLMPLELLLEERDKAINPKLKAKYEKEIKRETKEIKKKKEALERNPSIFYALEFLEHNGRTKEFLTMLSKYIPDNNELQFRGLNGKNQYPITEFTLFAEYIAGLNQAKTLEEYKAINPLAKSIYANNSLLLDSIFDENGNRIKGMYVKYIAADGNKVEGEVGEALKKIGTPDKLMFEFHATVLKNTYTLMQTSDKSTVLGTQLTKPLWDNTNTILNIDEKTGAPSIDIAFITANPKLVNTYIGYLKDEYDLIADYYANNGYKQYSNYNKFGGKLRFFNGVVSTNFENMLIESVKDNISFQTFFTDTIRTEFNKNLLNYLNGELTTELAEFNENGLTELHPLINFREQLENKGIDGNNYNTYIGVSRELLTKFSNNKDKINNNALDYMFNNAVLSYTINKQLAYIEQTKLFSGDLAFMNLAKQNEVFKRLPFLSATIRKAQNQTWLNAMFDNNANFLNLKGISLKDATPTISNIGWRSDRYNKKGEYINSNPLVKRGNVTRWYISDIILGQNEDSAIRQNIYNSGLLFAKLQGLSGVEATNLANSMASNYNEVKENDAQTYMSLDEYREFGMRTGQWNNFLEKAYWFQMNGAADNEYSDYNVSAFYNYPIYFTVVKPFGRGHQFIEGTGITIPQMDKQSIFPLLPSVIKGTRLELLAKFMQKEGIGHVLPASATKTEVHLLSNGKSQNLYDVLDKFEKGEAIEELVMDSVPYDTYGIQVRTENSVKDKTRDGTQKKKLTMSDLYEFGQVFHKFNNSEEITNLLEDYNNSYDAIFDYQYKQLAGELGISSTEGMSISKSTLVDRLYQSVLSSSNTGVADNVIESLKSIASLESIDHLNTRAKIESMISSIIDSKLIENKALGEGYIQVAVTGWEENKPRNFETDRTLKFYELVEKADGNLRTLPMQTMIPLPKELMQYVKNKYSTKENSGQLIATLAEFNKDVARIVELYRIPDFDENTLSEDDKVLNNILLLTGYRIPTQALNSIEFLQVVKFLHPYTNGIVLPSEITAKTGGDFDFDKMPVLRKGVKYNKETGKLQLTSQNDNFKQYHFNNIIDISIKLLALPQNFDRLITPDGSDLLKEIAEDIVEAQTGKTREQLWKETPYNSLFTAHYNNYVADINWVSKDLVGIGATNITHHVHAQLGNYFLFPYIKKPISASRYKMIKNESLKLDLGKLYFYEKIPYTTIFPHNITNYEGKEMISIAGVFDKLGENRISKVLGQSVTAFVDGAKDPLAYMLNLNSKTSGPFYQNIRQGNSLRTTLLYLSQPIIQELVKLQTINEAGFTVVADKVFSQMVREGVILSTSNSKANRENVNRLRPVRPNSELIEKLLLKYNGTPKKDISDESLLLALRVSDSGLQREILKQYVLDVDMAKELRNAAGVINIDTNGVGGSHAGVYARDNIKTRVQNVPHIFGVHNTLDPNQNFIGTMDKANNIAQGVFGALSIVPKSVFDYLYYKYPQIGEENTVKLFHLIKNDYISFLLQQHIIGTTTIGQTGIGNLKSGKDKPSAIVKLLAEKKALLESDAEVFADNKFLKEITMVAKTKFKGSDNDIVKMWGRMMKVDEVNRLLDDFETFYNYSQDNKQLVDGVLTALLVQSGLNKSPINFVDKVPYNIFEIVFDLANVIEQVKAGGLVVQVDGNAMRLDNDKLAIAFIGMFNITNKSHPLVKGQESMFVDNNEQSDMGDDREFKVKLPPYWLLNKYYTPITLRMTQNAKVLDFNEKVNSVFPAYKLETMKDKAIAMLASELTTNSNQELKLVKSDKYKSSGLVNNNIDFQEEQSDGYIERTNKNASADATIDFGLNQVGESWTKKAVITNNKKYIGINTNNLAISLNIVNEIVNNLNEVDAKTINIAGMGIYNMKNNTQEQVDNFVYTLLKEVLKSPNLKTKIESIRTGGQTGFDEAGAKAAIKLGIPTIVLAPKGWVFRNANNKDISSEQLFKDRFKELNEVTTVLNTNDLESRLATETEEELNNSYNEIMENEATDVLWKIDEDYQNECPF